MNSAQAILILVQVLSGEPYAIADASGPYPMENCMQMRDDAMERLQKGSRQVVNGFIVIGLEGICKPIGDAPFDVCQYYSMCR